MSTVPAQSHYVVRDAVRLHHLDWGNHGRHPVVLVHGSRLHAHVWNDYSRRAKDGYHVIAVDQRGHGDSGWGAPEAYHYEELYRDLRTVIAARGLKRYTLVGHSLGGMVSMLYAHRHHDELERLVLVDIAAGLPPAPPDTDFSRVAEVPSPRDFESHDEAADYLAGRAGVDDQRSADAAQQRRMRVAVDHVVGIHLAKAFELAHVAVDVLPIGRPRR